MPVKEQPVKGRPVTKQEKSPKSGPPNSPVRKQSEPIISKEKDLKLNSLQNSAELPGAMTEVTKRPHRIIKDTDDTQSIQDLTLTDDLAKNMDVASPAEKVRWKDGRYIGTDYVKLHIQKFFTRKVVHTRKEGDIDVQETRIKETEVKEERMKGIDTKEITVRKETTEEKWEELKTKTLEPAKAAESAKAVKPITSAVSMLEIRKQESPKKDPPKAISLENVAAKGSMSNEGKPFKIVTERATKKTTPQILDHIKTTKTEQPNRKSMPELMAPPVDKKVLSKPRPLSSYTLRDQPSVSRSRSSSSSTDSEKGIPEEPAQEPLVQKSLSMAKRQKPDESNKDVRSNVPPMQKISPKPEELKRKEKPDEYFEIIESSVKCFQTKIGKGLSKDSLLTDTKSNSSIGDDVVFNNKENKNTLNYRTQYKSVTPARELPTIIKSDQTYKLRDQYSLRRASEDSQGEAPVYRKDLEAHKQMKVNQAWGKPTRHMLNDQMVPEPRTWNSMEPSRKRMLFSERQVSSQRVSSTENTQQFVGKYPFANERERFTPDDRYEAETRRVLAEIQRHQYERPHYEEPFSQRQIAPDFLPGNVESPRRENQSNHLERRIPEQGKRRTEVEDPPELRSVVGEMPRPVLKKYMSEKSLPKSKGLRESVPAQPMHWSTVSLPDVQNVQESHKSNLNKWKETNLHTSSDSSDTIDAGSRPREEYNDRHNDKERTYLTGPYVMSYPAGDEDPKYFVKSVMDQARTVRYNDTSDERSGWIETDLDTPPGGQYKHDDHVYENDNSGWWVETDLDSMEESSRDNTFNRGFVSDSGRQDKYWKSPGTKKYPPYYPDEYNGFEGPKYHRNHRDYGVDKISSRRSHLYENLDTHVRYPGERDRYLDLSQELHPKHDEDPNPERERMRSTKRVHYEDQTTPHSRSSRIDDDDDEMSRSPLSKVRGNQQRDVMPVTNQKYNTMPDMKRHKKELKKKDHQHRHSDHGEVTNSYLYRDPYLTYDKEGSVTQTERDLNGFNPDKHERSFEISPDIYYSHSFGSSETNWRPYREVSQGYHSPRDPDEPYPQVHVGDPEYWGAHPNRRTALA